MENRQKLMLKIIAKYCRTNLDHNRNVSSKILFCLLIVSLSIISATQSLNNLNFSPINGAWQNFNHVLRFIDGQAPFADFSVYLGYGHLLLLS